MRRQTTKQPRGPATKATPRPPSSARQKKSPSNASMMVMAATFVGVRGRDHIAMEVMAMVVMVVIDRQRLGNLMTEGFHKSRVLGNILRVSAATYVLIKA